MPSIVGRAYMYDKHFVLCLEIKYIHLAKYVPGSIFPGDIFPRTAIFNDIKGKLMLI